MIWGLQTLHFCKLLTGRQNLSSPTCEMYRHFYLCVSLRGEEDSWNSAKEFCIILPFQHQYFGKSWESGSTSVALWTELSALFLGISFVVNTMERKETIGLGKDKEICATARTLARLVIYLEKEKHLPSSVHSHCKELANSGLGTQGCTAFSTKWLFFPKAICHRQWGRLDKTTVPAPPWGSCQPLLCAYRPVRGRGRAGCLWLPLKRCHKCL